MTARPSFVASWAAATRIYDANDSIGKVKQVIAWLTRQWGKPDKIVSYPSIPVQHLANQKGVILFEVQGWSDAAGHATFWNGLTCSDHCYFNAPDTNYTTTKANFWALS